MKKQTKANRQNPAIKGYHPIRIALPPIGGKDKHSFTSFIYIKEHIQKVPQGGIPSESGGAGATLFIANAPANGPIRTDLFLHALFESYGDIHRVTVAQDLRKVGSYGDEEDAVETFREAALMGLDGDSVAAFATKNRKGDGKFAHVVFTSGKELKKAIKMLKREISESKDDLFAIQLDEERMEQLKTETLQLLSKESHESDDDDDDESQDRDEEETDPSLTGIQAVAAEARRKAHRHISRQKLMQMCNDAMASFESEEAEAEQRAKMAADQPDEDGFITVSHKSTPSFGVANDLEENHHRRGKAGKRNRKRKIGSTGADELSDFYRFQLKERRKEEVQDLKKRFEEDLEKVKKMKEERAYRPF